ncbi:MAG: hypothetical protein LQ340_004564 [Diploschistes diacapsis]|nr:MAG: hypothetical protein LQ340_004564 [Diploschistes diacapsis]
MSSPTGSESSGSAGGVPLNSIVAREKTSTSKASTGSNQSISETTAVRKQSGSSTDGWEVISRGPCSGYRDQRQVLASSGGSFEHHHPDKGRTSPLVDKANLQTASSFSTASKTGTRATSLSTETRNRALSAAQSDSSLPGGIHPPPCTPETYHYQGEGEVPDAVSFALDNVNAQDAPRENLMSPDAFRKAAMLRAAVGAIGTELNKDGLSETKVEEVVGRASLNSPATSEEVLRQNEPTIEQPIPHVPSRFFSSEEWQSLHAKFEKRQKDTLVDGGTEGADTGVCHGEEFYEEPAGLKEHDGEVKHPLQKLQSRSSSTEEEKDFGVELTREKKRSSISEPEGVAAIWGESSVESVKSQGSGYVPRSMVAGTVLPERKTVDAEPLRGEHSKTFHAEHVSHASRSTMDSIEALSSGAPGLGHIGADYEPQQDNTADPEARLLSGATQKTSVPPTSPSTSSTSDSSPSKDSDGGVRLSPFRRKASTTSTLDTSSSKESDGGVTLRPTSRIHLGHHKPSTPSSELADNSPSKESDGGIILRTISLTHMEGSKSTIEPESALKLTAANLRRLPGTARRPESDSLVSISSGRPGKVRKMSTDPFGNIGDSILTPEKLDEEKGKGKSEATGMDFDTGAHKGKGKKSTTPVFKLPMRPAVSDDTTGGQGSSKNAPTSFAGEKKGEDGGKEGSVTGGEAHSK